MDHRLDQCDACTQANHDTIKSQTRTIRQLKAHVAGAEAAIKHLLAGYDPGQVGGVRESAAEAERARQDRARLPWRI
jgi:hypothetical protein